MDLFASLKISSSALAAQRLRLNTISSNVANAETTRTPEGGPYRKREVVFRSQPMDFAERLDQAMRGHLQGVEVTEIRSSPEPPRLVYDPGHPDADPEGMVALPNISIMEEMGNMMTASRAYEANVTAVQSAKRMAQKALEIGR